MGLEENFEVNFVRSKSEAFAQKNEELSSEESHQKISMVSINNLDEELLNNNREARNGTPNHLYDYSDTPSVVKKDENK